MKNRILLENYFLPGDLEAQIEAFVNAYNNTRYHESRRRIKEATFRARRLAHQNQAA